MVGYLTMTLIASAILRLLERALDGNGSYELVSEDALTLTAGTYRHPKKPEDLVERNLEEERGK